MHYPTPSPLEKALNILRLHNQAKLLTHQNSVHLEKGIQSLKKIPDFSLMAFNQLKN